MPMMWYSTGNGPAWALGMLAMWIFWFALLGVGIWALTRWVHPFRRDTPLETLHHRYARGEIDTPTYEQMHEQLLRTTTPAAPPRQRT